MTSRSFWRHIAILSSGTVLAQLITLACLPLLSRLYSPDAFGMLGSFMAAISIFSVVSALRYDQAIVLPKSQSMARALLQLALWIGAGLALLELSLSGLALLALESSQSWWLLVGPVGLVLLGIEIHNRWLMRHHGARYVAQGSLIRALATQAGQLSLFAFGAWGLLIGALVGQLATLFSLRWQAVRRFGLRLRGKTASLQVAARRYHRFALLGTPQALVNTVSQNFPVLAVGTFFDLKLAGIYLMADRILRLPVNFLAQSVRQVMMVKLANLRQQQQDARRILLMTALPLTLLFVFLSAILWLWGPTLFAFALGNEWSIAGTLAAILSIWIVFDVASTPAFCALLVAERLKTLMVYEVLAAVMKITGFMIGVMHQDIQLAVLMLSLAGAASCILLFLLGQRGARYSG